MEGSRGRHAYTIAPEKSPPGKFKRVVGEAEAAQRMYYQNRRTQRTGYAPETGEERANAGYEESGTAPEGSHRRGSGQTGTSLKRERSKNGTS